MSFLKIKRSLDADGIRNGTGRAKWNESNIKQIITNEKYIGDALLQKTYTVDIFEKKCEANKGQVPKYYVENSHEGIIPKDIFLKVQDEIARRANLTKALHSINEFIVDDMHYLGLYFVQNADISTAESNGITEGANPQHGVA